MAVITPLRAAFADINPRDLSYLPRRRSLSMPGVDGAALVAADLFAFVLASGVGATAAWPASMLLPWRFADNALPAQHLYIALLANFALLASVVLSCARSGHYGRRVPFWSECRDLLAASVIALLCCGFLQFVLQRHDSRLFLGLTWGLFPIGVMLLRTLARKSLAHAGFWQLRTVVVGNGAAAQDAVRALLSDSALGYQIAAIVEPGDIDRLIARRSTSFAAIQFEGLNPTMEQQSIAGSGASIPGAGRWVGRWGNVLRTYDAKLLVLALDGNVLDRGAMESLARERVPYAVMPRLDGLPVLGFESTRFFSHDALMFSYKNNLDQPVPRALKIMFDMTAALAMLVVLAPLLLLIALAVRLDGGPVLYAHCRVGLGGREFKCLKFRSMVVDSGAVLRRLLARDPQAAAEWANTQKLRYDPRVTWIGRTLRATSLDELPQLFNVLRGEMSLVGPRPIVPAEVARYGNAIAYYYEARPGVTGLWQVSGRSNIGYAERVQLDTWYIKNWTIFNDLIILAKTVPAVLKRQGAV